MRHIISVLMENEPGALSRVVGLFSQRGFNIESLTVAPTEDSTLSRLTVTTIGEDGVIEQITKCRFMLQRRNPQKAWRTVTRIYLTYQ